MVFYNLINTFVALFFAWFRTIATFYDMSVMFNKVTAVKAWIWWLVTLNDIIKWVHVISVVCSMVAMSLRMDQFSTGEF